MRSEVAEQIRPHYGMFRKTFIKKEFTTKVNKYIKYSEELLEEEIKKIFDREAWFSLKLFYTALLVSAFTFLIVFFFYLCAIRSVVLKLNSLQNI